MECGKAADLNETNRAEKLANDWMSDRGFESKDGIVDHLPRNHRKIGIAGPCEPCYADTFRDGLCR